MVKVKGCSFTGLEIQISDLNLNNLKEYFQAQKDFFKNTPLILFLKEPFREEEVLKLFNFLKNDLSLNIIGLKGDKKLSFLSEKLNIAYFPNVEKNSKEKKGKKFAFFGSNITVIEQSLRAGEVVESENSIIVLGDVNFGAKVISHENIYIMGDLRGIVICGIGKNYGEIRAMFASPQYIEICGKRKEFERDSKYILFKAFYRKGDLDITISSYSLKD
ncbi:MAG TPA: hypothetical protein EYP03_04405 [Aquificae bacterium]|nr:hypothetical protein [Aquificota bacterium]